MGFEATDPDRTQAREEKQPVLMNYWQKPKELLTIRKQREGAAAVTANKSIVIRGKAYIATFTELLLCMY